MKNTKKILTTAILTILIVPSLTYAAWWNPFSWFKKPTAATSVVQTQNKTVPNTTSSSNITPSTQKTVDQSAQIEQLKKEVDNLKKNQTKAIQTSQTTANPSQNTTAVQAAPVIDPPKTRTLPNGMILDDKGNVLNMDKFVQNQPTTASQSPAPAVDYKAVGENYFDIHKTCVGLDNPSSQYSYCVNYGMNQSQPTPQQISNQQNQQKTDRANALTSQYNSDVRNLEQQIIDIKTQYYADTAATQKSGSDMAFINGQIQNLTNAANVKIQKIQLQEQQLYLDYQRNLSNL